MNKKVFGILSLVFALSPVTAVLIKSSDLGVVKTCVIVYFILAILAIIFGFIGIKAKKGLSIAGIIIGFLSVILMGLALLGLKAIDEAKECVKVDDDKYKCQAYGQEIEIPGMYLRDDQKKDE